MQRRSKKKNGVLVLLLLAGGIYYINYSDLLAAGPTESPKPVGETKPETTRQAVDSWLEQKDLLPLDVSYQVLAGAPLARKFLCIGLSSVKRTRGSYLMPTLQSLFSQLSSEERSSMVVVVLLADFDANWRRTVVQDINTAFPSELEHGKLVVIHVPEQWYPPIKDLKRNYNDSPQRVTFRSKQNLDYSSLMYYSAGLGQYYLQLEDDVSSAKNFLTTIKRHIQEQEKKATPWVMLEFSALGFIGKLYRSEDLPLLARFLFLFYQEMPCDWLMSHFRLLLTQKEPILFKPSLFQHMGTFSSFQGTFNKLKDKDFQEEFYSNPPAEVFSDIPPYQKNHAKLAWTAGEGFFWGRSPDKGNYLTVVFQKPTLVTGILIETGSGGKDMLDSAVVDLGCDVVFIERLQKSCREFQSIGSLQNGRFEMQEIDKKVGSVSSCLRIQVTAGQTDWVIIRKIRIMTKASTLPHQAQL
ncbi:alpha-1,3-mannosyl-glycoprotein 4-beta-N-acetylglucosaminyltransferase C-like [Aulostomus maculatus]